MKFNHTLVLIILLCFPRYLNANMGEPIFPGTLGASPFLSKYVHVLKEDLFIDIDKNFETTQIRAVYYINSEKDGVEIPLLFYASDYQGDFQVYVDGKLVKIQEIPSAYSDVEDTKFKNFDYFFKTSDNTDEKQFLINESENRGFYISIDDMKYFETDLSKGKHKIEVTYTATKWTDATDWVREYSFRYALSPAKYWKSFGELNITINAENFSGDIQTNLSEPTSGALSNMSSWKFNALPTDVIHIIYKPEKPIITKILIAIRPVGASLIFGLMICFLHFKLFKSIRLKYPLKRFNWAVIIGSIIIPMATLLFWVVYLHWIKISLGEHSGTKASPYLLIFVPILLYPILLAIYWPVMHRFDKKIKDQAVIPS